MARASIEHRARARRALAWGISAAALALVASPAQAQDDADEDTAEAPAEEPVRPADAVLSLIGIAERHHANGVARTAIFAAGDIVHLVSVGETVLERFRVSGVGADSAEVHDVVTGVTRRFSLR